MPAPLQPPPASLLARSRHPRPHRQAHRGAVLLCLLALYACSPREDAAQLHATAQRLIEQRQYARAMAPLERAFALDPALVSAGVQLAEMQLQEEKHRDAVVTCARVEAALAALPGPADAGRTRIGSKAAFLAARSHRELGELEAAEAAARRSLGVLPRNPAAQALLGGILTQQRRPADALPFLQQALAAMTTLGVLHGEEQLRYQLAQCLAELGRTDEAEIHYRRHRELRALDDQRQQAARAAAYAPLPTKSGGASPAVENAAGEAPPDASGASDDAAAAFADVAVASGIVWRHDSGARGALHPFETMGGGAAWIDHDRDGDPDLYLVSGQAPLGDGSWPQEGKNRLYRNDAGRFVDVTAAAGVAGSGYGLGAVSGDVDNDGAPDLYVICYGPNLLYRNRGDGTFALVAPSGAEGATPLSGGAAFADFNGDGVLDLLVSAYFDFDPRAAPRCFERSLQTGKAIPIHCGPISYRGAPCQLFEGLGDGRFRDTTRQAGIAAGADAQSKGLGVLASDLDDDGDVDAFVACDTTANLLYRNRGQGVFDEVGLHAGVALSDTGLYEGSMGTALGDVNGDGLADILVTNFAEEPNRLYLGAGGGLFVDGTIRTGLGLGSRPLVGWGAGFLDAGCDGKLDCFVANGHIYPNAEAWLPGRTYRQRHLFYRPAAGRFEEVGETLGAAMRRPGAHRGAAFADYDLDGDVDIAVVAIDGAAQLLRAQTARGHWLEIDLEGSGPGGRDAIGARVDVETREGRQTRWRHGGGSYLSSSELRLHFGLGGADRVTSITVTWPGGRKTVQRDVAAGQRLTLRP